MKKEFNNYLEEISLSKTMIKTVIEKLEYLYLATNVREFDDIFLSEFSQDGNREYFSLWGFSESMFCKITIAKATRDKENQIVMFRIKENIARFSINNYNYDLKSPLENSFLETTIRTFDMEIPYNISATSKNCDYLMNIVHKYFVPQLIS